jgi:glycosyltransferase involved in cell wall biosynthesis
MKIWVMTNEYEGNTLGGLGTVATQLAKALAELNEVDVIVICKSASAKVTIEALPSLTVIRFPRQSVYHSTTKELFHAMPIVRWLRRNGFEKPDIIHVHSIQCDQLAKHYKRNGNVPIVYTCHSLARMEKAKARRSGTAMRQEKLIRMANVITTPSLWQKMQIKRYYPFFKKEISVIRNGVWLSSSSNTKLADANRLLFVGRLNHGKGIKELLQAVAILKKAIRPVTLHIIGGGSLSYKSKMKKLIRQLKIVKQVKWLKRMKYSTLQKVYSQFGCVVVPSRHESFGLVALEAMAAGVPLVSTRNGGLASFVNSSNATLIADVHPAAIASSIRSMRNNRHATLIKVNNAKNTAQNYGWKGPSEKYEQLFRRYAQIKKTM